MTENYSRPLPLFTTPKERTDYLYRVSRDHTQIEFGDAWRIAHNTGLWCDRKLVINDIAAVLLIEREKLFDYLHIDAKNRVRRTREELAKTQAFKNIWQRIRAEVEARIDAALNQQGAEERLANALKITLPNGREILESILSEIDDGDEDKPLRRGDHKILSPKQTHTLAKKLIGETIRFTDSKRQQHSDSRYTIPTIGQSTLGDVTDVTEECIKVDWKDGREYDLFHGVDSYEVINS